MTQPDTTARLLTDYEVSAPRGLATDEVLMGSTSLHLYTYEGAALVGRYQDLEANVDVEWCEDNGVAVNRRLTGGGAILMTPDQLGIALTLDRERFDLPRSNRALFETFGSAITSGLSAVGIDAEFVPKNDVVADGRKIAGLGLWDRAGEVQFHCSLLVGMDVERMLRALRISEAKLSDKQIDAFEERITTVREQAGAGIDEVAEGIEEGFADVLDVEFAAGSLTDDEAAEVDRLVAERYDTDDWRYRVTAEASHRSSEYKTEGGLLRVYAAVEDDVLSSIRLTGDFFARQETVNAIEAAVKWTPVDAEAIDEALADAPELESVDPQEVREAILAAATDGEQATTGDHQ